MTIKHVIVGLLAGTVLSGAAVAQEQEPFRLIVTHLEPPLVPNSVMDFAESLGYFDEEGVDVELVRVQQTPSALAALRAGDGEMANVGVDALLLLHASGSDDLIAVTSPNKSLPFLIAAKEEIATPEDLVGASFGVGRVGSLDHSLSTLVLDGQGIDIDDTQIVSLGQPSVRAQALAAGQVDATTMSIGVWSSLPDTSGLHVLIGQDAYYEAAPVVNKVNVVPREVLETRREDVVAVIRALTRLSRDFRESPDLWVDAMAEVRPDLDRATLEMLGDTFAGSWSVNAGMNADELSYTADWLYGTEDFQDVERIALDEWVDFGPADAVLEDLGTVEGQDVPAR